MKWWRSRPLYTKIFIGLILGIIIGFVAGEQVSFIMQPIGDIFLRMLQMLVAPVVFFTIVNGITKMEDTKTLASVGGRLFVYYALTSLLAVVVGAGLAMITQPGKGSTAFLDENAQVDASDFNLIDNIVSWVPTNPFQALNEANVLQILFFAIMLGISILTGTLASKLKENAKLSARDAFRTKILFNTSQLLQKAEDASEIFDITATKLVKLLGRDLTAAPAGAQESRIVRGTLYSAQTGGKTEKIFDPREQEIIQWVLDSRKRGEKCLDRGGGQRPRDSKRVQRACV